MSEKRRKKASSDGLFTEIRKHPLVLTFVILFHLGLVILLSINLASDDKPPVPSAQKHNIINAVVVNATKYDERKKQKELAVKKKQAEKKEAAELKRKKEAYKKAAEEKAVMLKKQKEIQLAKKKAEEKKIKEKKIKEKKEKQRKEKKRLEAEKKKKAEEKKKRIAAEKKAEEKKAAEKKRKAEEERKRRAEEKAELERSLLEEERREEEAKKAAARAARLQTQREQYIIQIGKHVENNWLRPATKTEGQSCDVVVTQTMRGDVIDVQLRSCTADNAFQRSVERAVRKASPLPLPPNPDVYDREIYFTFKPR